MTVSVEKCKSIVLLQNGSSNVKSLVKVYSLLRVRVGIETSSGRLPSGSVKIWKIN